MATRRISGGAFRNLDFDQFDFVLGRDHRQAVAHQVDPRPGGNRAGLLGDVHLLIICADEEIDGRAVGNLACENVRTGKVESNRAAAGASVGRSDFFQRLRQADRGRDGHRRTVASVLHGRGGRATARLEHREANPRHQ